LVTVLGSTFRGYEVTATLVWWFVIEAEKNINGCTKHDSVDGLYQRKCVNPERWTL